jgi:hypothetical protein
VSEDDPYLDTAAVADLIGVRPDSVRMYLKRAKSRRAEGKDTPADIPAPDQMFGRTPVWRRSTIEKWRNARRDRPNVKDAGS